MHGLSKSLFLHQLVWLNHLSINEEIALHILCRLSFFALLSFLSPMLWLFKVIVEHDVWLRVLILSLRVRLDHLRLIDIMIVLVLQEVLGLVYQLFVLPLVPLYLVLHHRRPLR